MGTAFSVSFRVFRVFRGYKVRFLFPVTFAFHLIESGVALTQEFAVNVISFLIALLFGLDSLVKDNANSLIKE
jgi:hypothetical protein